MAPVSAPPVMVTLPPMPVSKDEEAPDSAKLPPFTVVEAAGEIVKEWPSVRVVISGERLPVRAIWPPEERVALDEVKVKVLEPKLKVELAAAVRLAAPPEVIEIALAPVVVKPNVLLVTVIEDAPPEARVSAPAPELPMVIAPVLVPVPILIALEPLVLILVAPPVMVRPALPVKSPVEVVVPVTAKAPPILAAPPIPAPPVTTKAPVEELEEAVLFVVAIVPDVERLPLLSMDN